jgi:hypothetical protein
MGQDGGKNALDQRSRYFLVFFLKIVFAFQKMGVPLHSLFKKGISLFQKAQLIDFLFSLWRLVFTPL